MIDQTGIDPKLVLYLILLSVIDILDNGPVGSNSTPTTIDSFRESLTIRPLQDGKLDTRFSFDLETNLTTSSWESDHPSNLRLLQSDLIPISILELVDRFGIHQLSLSISRGRWEFDRWSHPIDHQWQGYPRGSELAVWLEPTSDPSGLKNTLAGMFCASLNRLNLVKDPPSELFVPRFSNRSIAHPPSFYHALLPIEQPCTENLSPLFKLLPCGQHAGLSSLIDSHKLFDGNWQSIRFKLLNHQPIDVSQEGHHPHSQLRLQVELETVLDPVRTTTKRDWNLESIFGKTIQKKCPLSSSSIVEIFEPKPEEEPRVATNQPIIEPRAREDGLPIDGKHRYDLLRAVLPLQIEMKWPNEEKFLYPEAYSTAPAMIKRLLFGHGQTRGSMGVEIGIDENQIKKGDHEIIYFEELPWWLSIYLHTLVVQVDGVQLSDPNEVVIKKTLKPSVQRIRPYTFSFVLRLPEEHQLQKHQGPDSVKGPVRKIRMLFEYEKDLLLYTEYPSDANRGFDLNPAGLLISGNNQSVVITSPSSKLPILDHPREESWRFWSTVGLINLATPDFSMPYNVIIVTSTAMALFFGSVFNLLVRDFRLIKLG